MFSLENKRQEKQKEKKRTEQSGAPLSLALPTLSAPSSCGRLASQVLMASPALCSSPSLAPDGDMPMHGKEGAPHQHSRGLWARTHMWGVPVPAGGSVPRDAGPAEAAKQAPSQALLLPMVLCDDGQLI